MQPGYDAASNVTSVATTLGTGGPTGSTSTDNQSFCYDEQNRLTWASSQTASGPIPPGSSTPCASNTAGSLTGGSALYTASYTYDTLDRLTSGLAGSSYTYGDAAQRHEQPTAAILDSRTVQSTPESGARSGYDGIAALGDDGPLPL